MKYIMLIADGMADHSLPQLGGKTPLQTAHTPNMDRLAKEGFSGLLQTLKPDLPVGSDVAILSLLGYSPEKCYTGRGPLEAASQGILLKGHEVAFRVNLVTVEEGKMKDYSAGHISSREARILINALNEKLGNNNIRFYPGVSYRNLLILRHLNGGKGRLPHTTPPHDIIGEPINKHQPRGSGANLLKKLMKHSHEILSSHPLNKKRVKKGLPPANMIWIWGGGFKPKLETLEKKYGVKGGVISAVDVINGLGRLLNMKIIKVRGATGDIHTNWKGKAKALIKALRNLDFGLLHVEAPDEASHMGDPNLKIKAIELFDREIVGRIADKFPEARIFVGCDHVTSTLLRTHTHDPVPFLLWGVKKKNSLSTFSEVSARFSGVFLKNGEELMKIFLGR